MVIKNIMVLGKTDNKEKDDVNRENTFEIKEAYNGIISYTKGIITQM